MDEPVDPNATGRRSTRVSPKRAAGIAYVVAVFMSAMDTHIVNVALPTLSRAFHSPIASVQWTVVAYVLSLAIWIPASGRIGDRIGTKRTFLLALGIFTIASALCGQARNLTELVVARTLQGTGGGLLVPTGTSMLYRAYPPEQRARLSRILILPILIAPAAAPVIGGLFVEKLSWRWIFYLNVPVGAAAIALGSRYLGEYREQIRGRFDFAGFLLSGCGLSLLLYAISEGSLNGWADPSVLATGVAGIALLVTFVRVDLRKSEPILKIRLLGNRLFRATNITSALSTASFLGLLYLTPIFLQEARHQSAISSGLTTFVEALGVSVVTQTLGRLYPRFGPRRMVAIGMGTLTVIIFLMTQVGPDTNVWFIRALLFAAGGANSLGLLSIQTSMFTGIAPSDTGHASAIFNTTRQSALALGVAMLSTIVASVHSNEFAKFHAAFFAAALLSLIGAVCGLTLIHDADARATMVRRDRGLRATRPAK